MLHPCQLEHILKALELLSEDQVGVPRAMFEEVIQAMSKEEQLETMTVVQRAISTSQQDRATSQQSRQQVKSDVTVEREKR